MTALFKKWFEEREPASGLLFVYADFVDGIGAAYLDVETQTKTARVTLWDNGNCDWEVLDGDGKQLLWQNLVFFGWPEAQAAIETFLRDFANDKTVYQTRSKSSDTESSE